ncbi:hypothetical protein SAMN05421839_13018 [Halolactibacillus halophilus]|uniref:Aldouronate transport system substrate-binding protein n=1 Tax=Halolactibacillus halophilus TaxID=306540 RepID=A0A1I5RHA4_9BACI|nr:hypothetical protein [Halolactibacillus halophilus]GEM02358.1 hypothetical protein HHA03_18900 [Halolactibacillus halophilus]SFP57954.1 hypothetical protein SAMN05421839_13018 [Halolactibacillus halophilus]
MLKKISFLLLVAALLLVGCGGLDTSESDESNSSDDEDQVETTDEVASNLKINYAIGNNQRTLTYNQSNPLELPDGTVVSSGELKPTWQHIQSEMGFSIEDVAVQDQTGEEMMEIASSTGFEDATIYGGAKGDLYNEFGSKGYFIDLGKRLDKLPNFSKYLEENPSIADSITAFDGSIYYIPYVAEIDNYARVLHGREDWVVALLDSADTLEQEDASLDVVYEGYWDRNDENVVALQNEAASGGALTQQAALDTLLNYIEETYPDLDTPSSLYLGSEAQYDIDELVALWRVMKLSPNTLSKVSTGEVVDGAIISPYFVRNSKNRWDILRMVNYFGGQRIFGSDTQTNRYYLDADGNFNYSFIEDQAIEGFDYLNQLYSEGLVHSEFADLNNTDNFRTTFYASDEYEGQKQFGFMTYDWIASTTATNEDVIAMLPPLTTLGDSDEMIHFIENTRTIKPEGWAISKQSSEEEINAALQVFDFFFSEEGNVVQNYGTPDMVADEEIFTGPDGVVYPKFGDWIIETANEFKDGDVSSFLRDFVGSQMALGYQKEIGFEYQYTVNQGFESWSVYQVADVTQPSYNTDNPILRLTPTVFSLTEQEQAQLDTTAVGENEDDQIFLYITGSENGPETAEGIKEAYMEAGIDTYIDIYKKAYGRMTGE